MQHLLEGKISVKAALLSPYRSVDKIIIDANKKDRDTNFIQKKAQELKVALELKSREEIDALCSGKTHGGIVAYVQDRLFQSLDQLLQKPVFLAWVEGVEDPFNYGFVLRSLYAAGVQGVIVSQRNWTTAASTLAKASAGASEFIAMYVSEDDQDTIAQLKAKQVQIICANRSDQAIEMYDCDFTQNICLCIGGEKRGLSKAILQASDKDVFIPYQNDFRNALSAASAATILGYEVLRQRR